MKNAWHKNGRGEWVCKCGVGHPDLAYAERSAKFMISKTSWEKKVAAGFVHGCCGCCLHEDFPGERMPEKMRKKLEREEVKLEKQREKEQALYLLEKIKETREELDMTERLLKDLEDKLNEKPTSRRVRV